MGRPKQLLPLGNKTVIRHCIDNIIAAGIEDTVVVVNPQGAGSIKTFKKLPIRFVINPSPRSEMVESVRLGLRSLSDLPSAVLLCLADHPLASASTMRSLVHEHYAFCDKIIIPVCHGKRGHPTLFPRNVINEVLSGLTLRDVIRKDSGRIRLVDVSDEGGVVDMDPREDYEQMLKRIHAA